MIIAIDGPAGSGKGTIANYLAKHYHMIHIDSGLFYRHVGWIAAKSENFDNDFLLKIARSITLKDLENPELKQEITAQVASRVAIFPLIRNAITKQLHILSTNKNAVVDGRDIGTVVFPDANIKFYITARPEVRYSRRAREMKSDNIAKEKGLMSDRDKRDQERITAPLEIAADAYVLDTSDLTIEMVCQEAAAYVDKHMRAA